MTRFYFLEMEVKTQETFPSKLAKLTGFRIIQLPIYVRHMIFFCLKCFSLQFTDVFLFNNILCMCFFFPNISLSSGRRDSLFPSNSGSLIMALGRATVMKFWVFRMFGVWVHKNRMDPPQHRLAVI